jgi:antirestriction protein ArdC
MTRRSREYTAEEKAKFADDRREKIEQMSEHLAAAVASIQGSDEFAAYLRTQARFHRYSVRNTLLILMQCPHATRVAGYRAWQSLGRQVRKGEKAIRIYAPMTFRAKEGQEGEEGSPTRTGFCLASVFNIDQTDGEELAEFDVQALVGEEGAELYRALVAVAAAQGVTLTAQCFPGYEEADGVYSHSARTIYIKPQAQLAMVVTLAHELAHALDDDRTGPAAEAETVAEGVAYLVLNHFGLEAGTQSFRYIAQWNRDQDGRATVMRCMQRIQRIAAAIIEAATAHLDPEAAQLDQQPAELERAA